MHHSSEASDWIVKIPTEPTGAPPTPGCTIEDIAAHPFWKTDHPVARAARTDPPAAGDRREAFVNTRTAKLEEELRPQAGVNIIRLLTNYVADVPENLNTAVELAMTKADPTWNSLAQQPWIQDYQALLGRMRWAEYLSLARVDQAEANRYAIALLNEGFALDLRVYSELSDRGIGQARPLSRHRQLIAAGMYPPGELWWLLASREASAVGRLFLKHEKDNVPLRLAEALSHPLGTTVIHPHTLLPGLLPLAALLPSREGGWGGPAATQGLNRSDVVARLEAAGLRVEDGVEGRRFSALALAVAHEDWDAFEDLAGVAIRQGHARAEIEHELRAYVQLRYQGLLLDQAMQRLTPVAMFNVAQPRVPQADRGPARKKVRVTL